MIRSFGDKNAAQIWLGRYVRGVDRKLQRSALRKLELLDAAMDVEDLRIPPGNRLADIEPLATA